MHLTLLSLIVFLQLGCSVKQEPLLWLPESKSLSSGYSYLQAYKNGEIKIKVPSGPLNRELNWETLFSHLPKSTQKEFNDFANHPTNLKKALDAKYFKTLRSLARDPDTLTEIKNAATLFKIDPLLILGNIIGEHTFNVGLVDSVQNLVALSAIWGARWALRFQANGVSLVDLVKKPHFDRCNHQARTSQADYWDCVAWVWNTQFRNRVVDGQRYQNNGFRFAFFNPLGSGITYGLGQMDPIRALMVTDRVNQLTHFRYLSIERPEEIYQDIINPRVVVYYISANIELALKAYFTLAHMDISQNPGIVATLYNLGREKHLAKERYQINIERLSQGLDLELPQESYYGFFVNQKAPELKHFLNLNSQQLKQFARNGLFPNSN